MLSRAKCALRFIHESFIFYLIPFQYRLVTIHIETSSLKPSSNAQHHVMVSALKQFSLGHDNSGTPHVQSLQQTINSHYHDRFPDLVLR